MYQGKGRLLNAFGREDKNKCDRNRNYTWNNPIFRGCITFIDSRNYRGNRGVKVGPMTEGEVKIETEMIQVDIEVLEIIGICTIQRALAQGSEVKRRDITITEGWVSL